MKCTICNGELIKFREKHHKDFLPSYIRTISFYEMHICIEHNCLTNNSHNSHLPNFFIKYNNTLYLFVWIDETRCLIKKYAKLNSYRYWFTTIKEINISIQHLSQDRVETILNFG